MTIRALIKSLVFAGILCMSTFGTAQAMAENGIASIDVNLTQAFGEAYGVPDKRMQDYQAVTQKELQQVARLLREKQESTKQLNLKAQNRFIIHYADGSVHELDLAATGDKGQHEYAPMVRVDGTWYAVPEELRDLLAGILERADAHFRGGAVGP